MRFGIGLFRLRLAQTRSQILDASFDIIADAAVGFYAFAERILDLPVFKCFARKERSSGNAGHVYDQIRRLERVRAQPF